MNLRKWFGKEKKVDLTSLDASGYFKLDDKSKKVVCQKLKIYDPLHFGIFAEVDKMFSGKFRFVKGIEACQCGLAPILGPSNCIKVFIPSDAQKVDVPKYFEGFPVIRFYENHTRNYRNMVDRIKNKTESA